MPKLKDEPIGEEDISEFASDYSDFSFEVKVLRKLSALGFDCEHAGTYTDPITQKTREFDIRARAEIFSEDRLQVKIAFSVECKNLKDNFPLVVHCMPRVEKERYLDLVWSSNDKVQVGERLVKPLKMRAPLFGDDCPYEIKGTTGKSTDQVGRNLNGDLIGHDGDVFEKMSQALNASYDLLLQGHNDTNENGDVITLVVPVLVVPNDRIWSIYYTHDGELVQQPTLEKSIEYFVGKRWQIKGPVGNVKATYFLSHLEIIQIDQIHEMVTKFKRLDLLNSSDKLSEHKTISMARVKGS